MSLVEINKDEVSVVSSKMNKNHPRVVGLPLKLRGRRKPPKEKIARKLFRGNQTIKITVQTLGLSI